MARRERERFTERNRPHRSEPGGDVQVAGSPFQNPVVLIAVAALVLAGIMALGFLFGRGRTDTAAAPTPTVGAADAAPTADAAAPADDAAATAAPADVPAVADTSDRNDKYTEAADQQLDGAANAYFATIKTAKGDMVLELWPEVAPQHVNAFVFLAREGFYDGLKFHRVEQGFVIQGGDPLGTGTGGPGFNIPAEFNSDKPVPHRAGTLAMARSGDPNSGGSQFYVVLEDGPGPSSLDGQYTVFGHVVQGMDVVRQIQVGDVMTSVTIEEKPKADSIVSPDDIRAGKLPEGIE